jgi:hypothetical protein
MTGGSSLDVGDRRPAVSTPTALLTANARSFACIVSTLVIAHAASATAQGSLKGAAGAPAIVRVRLYDQANVPAAQLQQAKAELTRICLDAGARIEWLHGTAPRSTERFTIQLIVRRTGAGVVEHPHVIGTVLGHEHEQRGTAFVFYEPALRLVHAREREVAQVLGYAMAHEIGHLLLPAPAHSSTGIMHEGWATDDVRRIVSGALTFTPAQDVLIRAKLDSCCRAPARVDAGAILAR